MTNQTESNPVENSTDQNTPLYNTARKVLLAAVGAAFVAQEEVEKLVNTLAARGEIAERDARRLVKEVMDKRDKMEAERRAVAQQARPEGASRKEIEELNARIVELTQKIEELKKSEK
jgi:polyhydroxyalkanoate synthesis regulator phasin